MKRKLLFLFAAWLATVVLMALQKPIFLLYYNELAAPYTWVDYWAVVRHGLLLDSTVAGYLTALPILFTLVVSWTGISERVGRSIVKGYYGLMAVVAAVLFAVDLGLYGYWGFRLDSTILIYLADPKGAMASIDLPLFLKQSAFAIGYGALLVWGWMLVAKLFDGSRLAWRKALAFTPILLLVMGLDFLAIRGGVGTSVANVSKVCFSSELFLNHAATNPIFSFLSTIGKQENYAEEYPFYEAEELAERFAAIRGNRPDTQPATKLLKVERPNILFVLLEGFGSTVMEAQEEGQAIAPNLLRYREEGIYFENLYANSFRTDRGQVAVLSGFPAQTRISLMKLTPKCLELPSIARSLGREGYRTHFTYGGDINFTNQSSYMYATGWQELYWQQDMSFDAPTSKWGYDDRVVGEAVAEEVIRSSKSEEPFLAGWLTLSSHEPFVVPYAKFEEKIANAFAFTDDCIGSLVERLRESEAWEKLLIVLVPDHGMGNFRKGAWSETEVHRIPMIWLGGAIKEPTNVAAYGSQIDIAATLLAQLGIDHSDFDYSKDLLDPALPKFGYYTYNEGFVVVDEAQESGWDAKSNRTTEGASEEQIALGRTLLQTTYEDIARR
ncbi:MAG: sulfatase-like hydrolase/transferase [Rikenellaceae bacterium]|nr:sulfatase-like hydrolase/transferase [Rikenellaceae bacterium]